jgi:hypothetical protein
MKSKQRINILIAKNSGILQNSAKTKLYAKHAQKIIIL